MEIAVRNGFLLEPLLNSMSPEVWDGYAETVTKQKDWGNMQEFYREIMPMLDKYPFYQRRLEQYFLEKSLNTGQLEPSALTERLLQYCTSVCSGADAVSDGSPCRPGSLRASHQISVCGGYEGGAAYDRGRQARRQFPVSERSDSYLSRHVVCNQPVITAS